MTADRAFEDVAVGEALPGFAIRLTLQRLVMEAGVNRDFSPWHFDPAAAAAAGADGPFANTTLVEALLEAGIRTWAGGTARIKVMDFAIRRPNVVGDDIVAAGMVMGVDAPGRTVALDIWLESARGRTVDGTAMVAF